MKKLIHSDWKLSVIALWAMIGAFVGIIVVRRELNVKFVMGYLFVVALLVGGNAIYVYYKSKKRNNSEDSNHNQG